MNYESQEGSFKSISGLGLDTINTAPLKQRVNERGHRRTFTQNNQAP